MGPLKPGEAEYREASDDQAICIGYAVDSPGLDEQRRGSIDIREKSYAFPRPLNRDHELANGRHDAGDVLVMPGQPRLEVSQLLSSDGAGNRSHFATGSPFVATS